MNSNTHPTRDEERARSAAANRRGVRGLTPNMRAFTVLEITVVFVVVALLAIIAIPTYDRFVSGAHDAAASEVVREVLSQSQALAASADRDEFNGSDLTDAVDGLPSDSWDASAPGVSAQSTGFVAELGGESEEFGEVAVGVAASGDVVVAKMRSRSGACVSGSAPIRGSVTVEVSAAAACDTTHTEPAGSSPTAGLELPECPSGPSLVAGAGSVEATWIGSTSPGLAGYDLFIDGADPPVTVGPAVTSYEFTGLNNDQTYTFSAVAFDAAGQRSAACAFGAATPSAVPIPAPAAPVLCSGGAPVCVEGDGEVTIHWVTEVGQTYQVFNIYRDGSLISVELGGAPKTFTDTGLTNGVTYQYWVVGVDDIGVSSPASNVVPLTPVDPAPGGPAGIAAPLVTVSAVPDRATATLLATWTEVPGATGYRVHVGSTSDPVVATVPAASPRSLELPGLEWGTTYAIWVVAYDASNSADAAGNGLTVPAPPAAPALQNIGVVPAGSTIRLTWASRPSATSYNVYNGDASTLFASPAATTWDHGGRSHKSSYSYRLRACNQSGCSNLGPAAAISTAFEPAPPPVSCPGRSSALPSNVTGCDRYRQLAVRWTAPANNGAPITQYHVRRQITGSGAWTGWTNVNIPAVIAGHHALRVGEGYQSGDTPLSYWDAFRLINGKAVLHWTVEVRACNVVGCSGSGSVTARPFSNDIYPYNPVYGHEELRRGQELTTAVRLDNGFGIYAQTNLGLQHDGNLVQRYRYRSPSGVWTGYAHVWNAGVTSASPSQALVFAQGGDGQYSGLLLGADGVLQWAIGGIGCGPWAPNARSFVHHLGYTVVIAEMHHRRNYVTNGGTYSAGHPFDGSSSLYQWTWATNTNAYAGCTGLNYITAAQADTSTMLPPP